ncbi:hypothetical protein Pint_00530 [Pistacia integerrima]|uniref:Uncharacterized protein n=1 Tax=Pistacia integerrima TaxID=434235 RepID=A0ACC0ZML5_9ROSI|nr:hypothetical protein Pint_00530 [Pistacia integerrima]
MLNILPKLSWTSPFELYTITLIQLFQLWPSSIILHLQNSPYHGKLMGESSYIQSNLQYINKKKHYCCLFSIRRLNSDRVWGKRHGRNLQLSSRTNTIKKTSMPTKEMVISKQIDKAFTRENRGVNYLILI